MRGLTMNEENRSALDRELFSELIESPIHPLLINMVPSLCWIEWSKVSSSNKRRSTLALARSPRTSPPPPYWELHSTSKVHWYCKLTSVRVTDINYCCFVARTKFAHILQEFNNQPIKRLHVLKSTKTELHASSSQVWSRPYKLHEHPFNM